MSSNELQSLRQQLEQLQQQNNLLKVQLAERNGAGHEPDNQALADTQQRYRFLFEAMDEGFCIIEFFDGPHGPLSDYIHIEANAAYAKHAGIDNVVGQTLRQLVPDEAEGWIARYGPVLHSGNPIRFEQELVATGRHLDICAFRMEPASRKQVAVLFQDVTARKRAESALRRLNQELEQRVAQAVAERKILTDVVEATLAQIQVVDLDMRWLAINRAARDEFQRLFGLTPSVGDSLPDQMAKHPEDCARGLLLWTRALKGEAFVEIAEFGAGDQHRHYELRFSPLHDPHGQLIGAYLFAYDISERIREQKRLRKTEEALRQAQKMEAVGQLTGGIAHDFNNLLTGISGSLELSRNLIGRGRHQHIDPYLRTAQDVCNRAASLVHRLLAFSRRQTLEPRTIDVNRLVSGMTELIRRSVGPHIEIELFTASATCRASIDSSQLENALLNLCINARDAMPGGGRITIETRHLQADDQIAAHLDLPPGDYLALSVSDNGRGMSPQVLARAFDPFFTTKPVGQGTGLGLSMVYGFVRQSGGQVRVYSEPGQGTSVHLYLPRLDSASLPASEPLPVARTPRELRDMTVMLVDDEATIRMLVGEVLSDLGYTKIEFGDGHSALAALQNGAAIDLLISDVGMPGGMNGQQLVAAARQLRPGLKVLFITGYAEQAVLGGGVFEPTTRVLSKPFSLDTLAQRIEEMIG
ncbi:MULTISPECIES: PAS domain-containing protein [Pseudomonas]|uniref:hybrid sensor histidine kinase/response regulator n=1 Tax=Pseudomonas TaxID=286 RepID=UPI001BD11517|nr:MULTISPECIES: PAS domain-containing protein [Pseudomonas]MBS7600423.1 PAS domain-containing protein [Pseudomonas sp. RC2C2]UVL26123.1 PAS domain-containing protein [Pseudomonas donghuensis]